MASHHHNPHLAILSFVAIIAIMGLIFTSHPFSSPTGQVPEDALQSCFDGAGKRESELKKTCNLKKDACSKKYLSCTDKCACASSTVKDNQNLMKESCILQAKKEGAVMRASCTNTPTQSIEMEYSNKQAEISKKFKDDPAVVACQEKCQGLIATDGSRLSGEEVDPSSDVRG